VNCLTQKLYDGDRDALSSSGLLDQGCYPHLLQEVEDYKTKVNSRRSVTVAGDAFADTELLHDPTGCKLMSFHRRHTFLDTILTGEKLCARCGRENGSYMRYTGDPNSSGVQCSPMCAAHESVYKQDFTTLHELRETNYHLPMDEAYWEQSTYGTEASREPSSRAPTEFLPESVTLSPPQIPSNDLLTEITDIATLKRKCSDQGTTGAADLSTFKSSKKSRPWRQKPFATAVNETTSPPSIDSGVDGRPPLIILHEVARTIQTALDMDQRPLEVYYTLRNEWPDYKKNTVKFIDWITPLPARKTTMITVEDIAKDDSSLEAYFRAKRIIRNGVFAGTRRR
jgi:hypothetical protein